LSFFELPTEQQPPEEIWLNDEALSAHFEAIRQEQQAKAGNETIEVPDMEENELTRGLRRR
jgi:hypothetical protein